MTTSGIPPAGRLLPIVPTVVRQHVEESDFLSDLRTTATHAPHVTLSDLRRVDDRLAAHLRGLSLAGEQAWSFCESALTEPTRGSMFTAAVQAIEQRRNDWLERLFARARDAPAGRGGLTSAFGWLEPEHLQGIVATLLRSEVPFRHLIGLGACAMHRVDPGLRRDRWLQDPDPAVRARALRASGELGSHELSLECEKAIADEHPDCRVWAAWSAVMLGNRGVALEALTHVFANPGAHRSRAIGLMMQASSPDVAHIRLQELGRIPENIRWLLLGSGMNGDPAYVSWQIGNMSNEKTSRLAGEAFSLITGADLVALRLDSPRPPNIDSGPSDDPDDPNVEMDPDDGLPWPDPERIHDWWSGNSQRFEPGTRYFLGAPVTREHCIHVLKNGYQRQRILAAHYLCLLDPGTPLFNTSAPAWRQQRLLAQM
jgi:uncharacterized protein (TIGR02270 family)